MARADRRGRNGGARPPPRGLRARRPRGSQSRLRDLNARALRRLDYSALLLARTRGHPRWAERAASACSRTGEHAACWLVLGLAGAALADDAGRRRAWLRGVRVVVGAYAINYVVKVSVRRHRPELSGLAPLTPTVSRLSFPSAHATTSFAAARAFSPLAPKQALYGVAAAFALSRPYLGVHYPSDVLAGAVLGTAIAEAWPGAERSINAGAQP